MEEEIQETQRKIKNGAQLKERLTGEKGTGLHNKVN